MGKDFFYLNRNSLITHIMWMDSSEITAKAKFAVVPSSRNFWHLNWRPEGNSFIGLMEKSYGNIPTGEKEFKEWLKQIPNPL